jgi:hypothetical protein
MVFCKKLSMYMAKDSTKALGQLAKMLALQVEDLEKLIPKPPEPLILDTNPFEDVEESKEEFSEDLLQRQLDEYLITDYKAEEEEVK